jgi:hypothetical protein
MLNDKYVQPLQEVFFCYFHMLVHFMNIEFNSKEDFAYTAAVSMHLFTLDHSRLHISAAELSVVIHSTCCNYFLYVISDEW